MANKKSSGFLIVTVIIIVIAVFVLYGNNLKASISKIGAGSKGDGNTYNLDKSVSLMSGSRGQKVEVLQAILNKVQPTDQIAEDGIFGSKTKAKLYSVTGKYSITLSEAYKLTANM